MRLILLFELQLFTLMLFTHVVMVRNGFFFRRYGAHFGGLTSSARSVLKGKAAESLWLPVLLGMLMKILAGMRSEEEDMCERSRDLLF